MDSLALRLHASAGSAGRRRPCAIRIAPSTSDASTEPPFCRRLIERIERAARLVGGHDITVKWRRNCRAARRRYCRRCSRSFEVLVELTEKLAWRIGCSRTSGRSDWRRSQCGSGWRAMSKKPIRVRSSDQAPHTCISPRSTLNRLGKQAVRTGADDSYPYNVTDLRCFCINIHRLQPRRTADELAGHAARLFQQQIDGPCRRSHAAKAVCCFNSSACSRSRRSVFTSSATWSVRSAPGVPGRLEYLKEKACA